MTQIDVVEKLQTLISEGDEVDRCYAIQSLVTMGHNGANDLLVDCLRDEDIDVCIDAVNALAELGDHSSSEKLIESLLNDPDGEVKTACIRALASLSESKAIPLLLKIIEERPEDIAFEPNDWDYWWDMQLESIQAMGTMQVKEAIPALQRILESGDYLDIEEQIFRTLVQIGNQGEALLTKLLDSGDSRTRRRVVKALGRSQSNETLKSLARALRDNAPEVRISTLNSLAGRRNAIHYLPIILHLFKDEHAGVRQSAIKAAQQLSQQADSDAEADYSELVRKILPMLDDNDPLVKSTVLELLTRLEWQPDRKTQAKVIQLLGECEGDCFGTVCRFITQYRLTAAIADMVLLYKRKTPGDEEKQHIVSALGQMRHWDKDIELLLGSAIYDSNKNVRLAALEALANLDKTYPADLRETETRLPFDMVKEALHGRLTPPASQQTIPVSMGDPRQQNPKSHDPDGTADGQETQNGAAKREEATETHAQVEMNEGDDFVARAMEEISKSIRDGENPLPLSTLDSMAITCAEKKLEAQAEIDTNTDGQLKENATQDTNEEHTLSAADEQELKGFLDITRANAETAKWLFNKEVVPVELDIQRLAARLLGNIGSSRLIPALLDVFEQQDSLLKREAILSIGQIAKAETPSEEMLDKIHLVLIQALKEPNRELRVAAIRVLGELGTDKDIHTLLPLLADGEIAVRIHTTYALGKLAQATLNDKLDIKSLLEQLLGQLDNNETGLHRAVVDTIIPLFTRLNGDAEQLKQAAIERIIESGLAGSDGQVIDMTRGLSALDKERSSDRLLLKLERLESSVERRYVVEMLGELHRPTTLH